LPAGTLVTALSGDTVTLSAAATVTSAATALSFSNAPLVATALPISGSASAILALTFPGFNDTAPSRPISVSIPDVNNPGTLTLDTSQLGPFAAFQDFTYADVLSGLGDTLAYLQNY